jgi:hypothetical protein
MPILPLFSLCHGKAKKTISPIRHRVAELAEGLLSLSV